MLWTDTLKALIQHRLARRGYTFVNIERMEALMADKMEDVIRLFSKSEEFLFPPNDMRARLIALLQGTSVLEGLFLLKYLYISMNVEGDICEFGVAQGATSALLANELLSTNRHIWLFDSFAGLPEPTAEDELADTRDWTGRMSSPRNQVEKRLCMVDFPRNRTHIIAGFFPESARNNAPNQICFAYVDFDLYRSIRDALRFIDARMTSGGIIVVDDYGPPQFPGVRKAVHEFISCYNFDIWIPDCEKFVVLSKRSDGRD